MEHKNIIYLDTPLYNISSTRVREKLAVGDSVEDLLPDKVAKFIKENGLYNQS